MKFIVIAALVLGGFNALAEEAASTAAGTPLSRGHWQIAGSAQWSAIGTQGTTVYLAPRAEYFLCDHLSLGGTVAMYFSRNYTDDSFALQDWALGPSATLYFSRSTIAPYVSQQVLMYLPKYSGTTYQGITGLGVAFFANEHISISPELDAAYQQNTSGDLSLFIRIATYL